MSTSLPAPAEQPDQPERATGPGWPGEDHERDALLDQDPAVTYQDGGLATRTLDEAEALMADGIFL